MLDSTPSSDGLNSIDSCDLLDDLVANERIVYCNSNVIPSKTKTQGHYSANEMTYEPRVMPANKLDRRIADTGEKENLTCISELSVSEQPSNTTFGEQNSCLSANVPYNSLSRKVLSSSHTVNSNGQ
jgi:hypothetical protein